MTKQMERGSYLPAGSRKSYERKERQLRFLQNYKQHGSIWRALEYAKISRAHFYLWLKEDTDFAEIYHEIEQKKVDKLEESAFVRAEEDTTLTTFLLKAHRPKTYRDDTPNVVERKLIIVCSPEVAQKTVDAEVVHSKLQIATEKNGNGNSPA